MTNEVPEHVRALTPEEIRGIARRTLFMRVVEGIKYKLNFSIGIMLDVDEPNEALSLGTGKVLISAPDKEASAACKFVRHCHGLKGRCAQSDLAAFTMAKDKILENPKYRGEPYWCESLHLQDFVIPIYEKTSRTFIGVILGGQRREPGSRWAATRNLKEYVKDKPELKAQFRKLKPLYIAVPQVDEALLKAEMEQCRLIAKDIAALFRFYIDQKVVLAREENLRAKREKNVAEIHRMLMDAQSSSDFWKSMGDVAESLFDWMPADWCLILRQHRTARGELVAGLKEVARAKESRGLKDKAVLEGLLAAAGPFKKVEDAKACIEKAIQTFVSPTAHCLVFPVADSGPSVLFVVIGSAPEHRKTNPDYESVVTNQRRIAEVINAIGMQFRVLMSLEREYQKVEQLQAYEGKLQEQVQLLETTLMSLNHQLHGPLWMLSGILTNVRDFMGPSRLADIMDQIKVGVLVAKHGSLLCAGMASVLASEQGRKHEQHHIGEIDVEKELIALADSMEKTFQCEHRRIVVRLRDADPIRMSQLDFFFVFYCLLENALKYSDPDKEIHVECSWEQTVQKDCFKIRSVGPPIQAGDVELVFRKFWRHEDAWQDDELGLGLGCWAARECMKRAGGDLLLKVSGSLSVFIVVPPTGA